MKKLLMSRRAFTLAVFILGFTSCAETPEYGYIPVSHQINEGKHRSAAVYSIPENSPSGNLRIFSTGIVDLKSKTPGSKPFSAVHMRMAISNQSSNQIWFINTQNLVLSFPNAGGQIAPVFVNSDSNTIPDFQIHPGELKTLDLYYELPTTENSAQNLPVFDFHWQIEAGSQLVSETTPFDRVPIPDRRIALYPYDPYYPVVLGVGGVWWARPGWGHRGWGRR